MSDIPDKVISDAVKAVPATQAGVGSARMVRQIVVPAAPVIAGWAARQERVRIRERLAGLERYELTSGGLLGSSVTISAAADWMNYRHVLAALDREDK